MGFNLYISKFYISWIDMKVKGLPSIMVNEYRIYIYMIFILYLSKDYETHALEFLTD